MRSSQEIIKQAVGLFNAGRLDEAGEIYERLLAFIDEPEFNILLGLGTIYASQARHGLGIHFIRQALAINDEFPQPWNNLGLALKSVGRDQASLECYERVIAIDPKNPEGLCNLAGWHVNRGEPAKVIDFARKALAVSPELPDAHLHLALGLLEAARYAEAWPHYEYRWSIREKLKDRRPYNAPRWTGETVGTLAIHGEQGLGDEIMFMGCFQEAAKRARRVVVECAGRLIPLFQSSFDAAFYPDHARLIEFEGEPDAYAAMGSLPGIVGMPDGLQYLRASPSDRSQAFRVGIAWRGGSEKTNKRERSLKPEQLCPIIEAFPAAEFVSVQYGDPFETGSRAQNLGIKARPTDFDTIVADIASCDLVISVCQTAVHLAGAMGIPCWVLTPKAHAWRYAGGGEEMAWYKSVRLIRQGDDEQWGPVIARIAQDLRGLIPTRGANVA